MWPLWQDSYLYVIYLSRITFICDLSDQINISMWPICWDHICISGASTNAISRVFVQLAPFWLHFAMPRDIKNGKNELQNRSQNKNWTKIHARATGRHRTTQNIGKPGSRSTLGPARDTPWDFLWKPCSLLFFIFLFWFLFVVDIFSGPFLSKCKRFWFHFGPHVDLICKAVCWLFWGSWMSWFYNTLQAKSSMLRFHGDDL